MKYLQQLKDDLLTKFESQLTADKVHLFLVNGELASNVGDIAYTARFLFIDCRDNDPFGILTFIRKWFQSRGYPVPDLNFDSEIIDAETYDLSVDIGLVDKLVIDEAGDYHLCPPKIWSEELGNYVTKNEADAFLP